MPGTAQPIIAAALGGQPQEVTFVLDALLTRGEQFGEIFVVRLSPAVPRVRAALGRLEAELRSGGCGGRPGRCRAVPVRRGGARLKAPRDDSDASAV